MERQIKAGQAVRQGDVLVERVRRRTLPKGTFVAPRQGRLILAYGEATGHHHSVAVADGEMVETAAHEVFLQIMKTTDLQHQEHGSLRLDKGVYKVTIQQEYQPRELPRRVVD
ncbi:MAG TPA: hypothetical protein VMW80_14215 [Candidatus Dormibacteraeota bacterium]|nr:hypothetical protein [Candidatus Dormibacteraeota bacterium]